MNGEVPGRRLIFFPIIHSQVDMGALSDQIRELGLQTMGKAAWKRKSQVVDRLWIRIAENIDGMGLVYDKVRLYQDGLPVCDREAELVRELASAGSPNYRLLLRLMEKGAVIMGTESSVLLIEEYELNKQTLGGREGARRTGVRAELRELSRSLLERRDRFVGDRINRTLFAGETGILFLGLLHSPQKWLASDVSILYPLGRWAVSGADG